MEYIGERILKNFSTNLKELTSLGSRLGIRGGVDSIVINNIILLIGSGKETTQTYFDLGIIIDGSIDTAADFKKLKSFLTKISSNFVFSSQGNHAGIILYNADASLEYALADFQSNRDLENAIRRLSSSGGKPRMDKALNMAYNKLFSEYNGMRKTVPRILVVVFGNRNYNDLNNQDSMNAVRSLSKAGTWVRMNYLYCSFIVSMNVFVQFKEIHIKMIFHDFLS